MTVIILIIVYIIGAILAYGRSLYYWQAKFPLLAKEQYVSDLRFSIFISLFSWASYFVIFIFSWAYDAKKYKGFKFK